jgi:2-iminobutanoate/2-iminopropanoate deaminase
MAYPPREVVATAAAPAAIGPYSQAVAAGPYLFTSGQIGFDAETGTLVGEDVSAQTRQAMANISAILNAAGLSFADVVKTTIFLTDMDDFVTVNRIYSEAFADSAPPARSTVAVAALPRGAQVEIETIALRR